MLSASMEKTLNVHNQGVGTPSDTATRRRQSCHLKKDKAALPTWADVLGGVYIIKANEEHVTITFFN